ncbi:hypothetical protein EXU85_14150 [Spirosoma sp. KCTC 42546]|uniref:HNH endonuclease n=1 Tax=Spirosoma sp. KCTC 42546 TaxID=2520506 RepID=UPI00115998F1|nr:hypothetical protein [Spirosoma sp. KCTC 42546]QDK79685.1 hypothetical protein EXU85_14150 [Spirosoma sp. KCTC 42546]
MAKAFRNNNAIEGLCAGVIQPVLYTTIESIDTDLAKQLKTFCYNLYIHVFKLQPFYSRCGHIDDHYDAFMRHNVLDKCPFCGLSDVMSERLSVRDAYDHYLPKSDYPFNTVNLSNLVPACKTCNTSYKLAIDPILGGTRKAFYPFSSVLSDIIIQINIIYLNYKRPDDNRVEINLACDSQSEELITWEKIYRISERYIDKCRSDDSRYWITQVYDELSNHSILYGQTIKPDQYLTLYLRQKKKEPMKELNFLRVPFLEGCLRIGVFDKSTGIV